MDKAYSPQHSSKRAAKHGSGGAVPAAAALKAFIFSVAASAVLLLLFSVAAYSQSDPEKLIRPLGIGAAAVSAMASGFAAARLCKEKPLPSALLCGVYNIALTALLSLVFGLPGSMWLRAAQYAGVLLLSALGGLFGSGRSSGRHIKRRR